ncbi:MAG: zinc-dependent peptidase [Bacteroidia bacterium]
MVQLTIILAGILIFYSPKIYRTSRFLITKNYYVLYGIEADDRSRQFELEAMLEQEFVYFKPLSPMARQKFIARIWKLYNEVEFVGYSGLEVKENMKIRVLFSQIQLTYGLRTFHFKKFKKYILYPTTFYSNFFQRDLKGLTSRAGFVTFSWADFEEGYKVNDDKFNLGLHEMAHAFRLHVADGRYSFKLTDYHIDFDAKAHREMYMMKRDVPSLLRDYAKTNHEEFFAVCIEYFFEAPEILKNALPQIFNILCKMLNQNPLNREGDYAYK